MKKMIEFDNIVGGQDGGDQLHLKVTREAGHYGLTVSRRNPDGTKHMLVYFELMHADVQAIANLAEQG